MMLLSELDVEEFSQRIWDAIDRSSQGPSSRVANISVRTGERFEVRGLPGDPNRHDVRIPTVEVWIGGKKFIHDCMTDDEARQMVFTTALDLGLGK